MKYFSLFRAGVSLQVFSKDSEFGSAELAIQPHAKADLTVIEMGLGPQLRTLEATIREGLDNPDDFIDSLLEE